jgi:NitT/TauT family transport system substrate-binding protein
MRSGRRLARLALAATLVLLPAIDVPAPLGAQTDQVVHVGASSFEANAGVYYALENGFFKQVGINVEAQPYNNGAAIAAAVAGGTLQIGCANPLPVAVAHERGLNFVIIAPGTLHDTKIDPPNFMVAPNSPIRNGKDLNGATIGVTALQGLDPLGALGWIDKHGGDSRTVKLIELPHTLMADAVNDGRVAAALMADPARAAALTSGKVRSLADSYESIGNRFFVSSWFANRDWADKNADVVRRFRIAIDRAGEWATRNPEPAALILKKYMSITEARAHEEHARSIDPSFVQQIIDAAVRYKYLDHAMDARDIIWTGPRA